MNGGVQKYKITAGSSDNISNNEIKGKLSLTSTLDYAVSIINQSSLIYDCKLLTLAL